MKKLFKNFYKNFPYIILITFSIFTIRLMSTIPMGEAEAHAWTIAGNVNIFQLIDLMNVEGHFLVWFLCIMPFAKFPNLYPWVMQIINWCFCAGALIILWKKAPFDYFTKTCITFSAPFLQIYAVYPRCYAIGIFFLFLAISMYNERLQKPYKYIITLTIAANTSILALIAAGILGILFIFDLVKQKSFKIYKKLFYFISLIVLFNSILFFLQFHNVSIPDYENSNLIKAPLTILAYFGQDDMLNLYEYLKIVFLWILTPLFLLMFWKNKTAFIFFISTEVLSLLFFTFVYGARYYHTCFLFIFAIIAFWILKSDKNFSERFVWKTTVFAILAFGMIFVNVEHLQSYYNPAINPIMNDKNLQNGALYTNIPPMELSVLLPYLSKNNQTIYDTKGRDLSSYEGLKTYFNKDEKINNCEISKNILDINKQKFLLSSKKIKKCNFDIELYKTRKDFGVQKPFYIYKIKNTKEAGY